MPLTVLCRRILIEGHWPATWRVHRLCPLYKKLPVYDANNYKGVHITSILSKVAERIIGGPLLRFFETANCYGNHQWAYRKHRSSSDLITLLMCSWLFSVCVAANVLEHSLATSVGLLIGCSPLSCLQGYVRTALAKSTWFS